MKIAFTLLFVLALFIYMAEPRISMKPFSLKFTSPYLSIGVFCAVLAMAFIGKHYQDK